MKKTIMTFGYFITLILVSGSVMLMVAGRMEGSAAGWLTKQLIPHVTFTLLLLLGWWVYRLRPGRGAVLFKGKPSLAVFSWAAGLGFALFFLSAYFNELIGIDVGDGSVHELLPPYRFYPYLFFSILLVGIMQPMIEEAIFRGEMLVVAHARLGVVVPVIVVSLLFSALHPAFFISSFFFSAIMCAVRLRFDLFPCLVAHCAYNVSAVMVDAF